MQFKILLGPRFGDLDDVGTRRFLLQLLLEHLVLQRLECRVREVVLVELLHLTQLVLLDLTLTLETIETDLRGLLDTLSEAQAFEVVPLLTELTFYYHD
jgi:hypothetical protein